MARLGPDISAAPTTLPRRDRTFAGDRSPFQHVAICRDLADAADTFEALRARTTASPYQRLAWLEAWVATEGRRLGIRPMIVLASDAAGLPVAALPLGTCSRRGLRCAEFLGGRESNYNLGLFDPGVDWRPTHLRRLLAVAATLAGGLDLYRLIHQPIAWDGVPNPLAALPRSQPSPSFAHRAALMPDAEAFMRKHLSGAARKKLRAKATHLAALGSVTHEIVREPAEVRAVLDVHLAQKTAKLGALGISVPDPDAGRALLERACLALAGADAPVEVHALRCGERIVATFAGLPDRGRFSGLFISYDQEPDFARCSPGELLLNAVLRQKCAQGFRSFDLGIGEARYKDSYCPEQDLLVDCVLPLTARGNAAAALALAALRLKTAIKQSPRAWALAQAVRKRLRTGR